MHGYGLKLRSAPEYAAVPDYAFDCHTRRGKSMGKTKADFFRAEQAALVPLEQGLFDHLAGEPDAIVLQQRVCIARMSRPLPTGGSRRWPVMPCAPRAV
jgi:hypothetical protein